MDIEFHYYMTYAIATRAGFSTHDAEVIAYSAQYVDDNDRIFRIQDPQRPGAPPYCNYITQTLNILKPKRELMRIYPLFHFIPGDPLAPSAQRRDGKLHWLNTTPDSANANRIMDEALASGNLYRIGIASHSYVDTWAHQNFVGYYDAFNAMRNSILSMALPNIGHADAKRLPDWPGAVWSDRRLLPDRSRVDNTERFMAAAQRLFHKYCQYLRKGEVGVPGTIQSLVQDLRDAIGEPDRKNLHRGERIERYRALTERPAYGGKRVPEYDCDHWLDAAIHSRFLGIFEGRAIPFRHWTIPWQKHTWYPNYQTSHWYQFQEAAKSQQHAAEEVVVDAIIKQTMSQELALENW